MWGANGAVMIEGWKGTIRGGGQGEGMRQEGKWECEGRIKSEDMKQIGKGKE